MRQWLNAKAIRDVSDELSLRLLKQTEAPITPYKGYVRFETDTFVMDDGDTKKEDIGRQSASGQARKDHRQTRTSGCQVEISCCMHHERLHFNDHGFRK